MELGKNVRKLRIEKKLTQQELAVACDLSVNYISRLERGAKHYKNPTLNTLVLISKALSVQPNVLLTSSKAN